MDIDIATRMPQKKLRNNDAMKLRATGGAVRLSNAAMMRVGADIASGFCRGRKINSVCCIWMTVARG